MRLRVERAGLLCTVQGPPRIGFERIGVPRSGPMDPVAWQALNALLGNPASTPVLEWAGGPLRLRADGSAWIAVLAPGFELMIGGAPRPIGFVQHVDSGQVMEIRPRQPAGFGYLGIAGQWDVPSILGSAATDLRNTLGGMSGRTLRAGDELSIEVNPMFSGTRRGIRWPIEPDRSSPWRVIIHEPDLAAPLLSGPCRIGQDSNRQAVMIDLPQAVPHHEQMRISAPQWPGAIQALPDGRFVLLGPEAQTVGGYPLVASLVSADLPRLGRWQAGETIRFASIDGAGAARLAQAHQSALKTWLNHLAGPIDGATETTP